MGYSLENKGIIYTAFERVMAPDLHNRVTAVTRDHHGVMIAFSIDELANMLSVEPTAQDITTLNFFVEQQQRALGEPAGYYNNELSVAFCANASDVSIRVKGANGTKTRTVGSASSEGECRQLLDAYRDKFLFSYCVAERIPHLLTIHIDSQVTAQLFDPRMQLFPQLTSVLETYKQSKRSDKYK